MLQTSDPQLSLNLTIPPRERYPTPRTAADAARNGLPGYMLAIQSKSLGTWSAHPSARWTTPEIAAKAGGEAIVTVGDPSRVAVVADDGSLLQLKVPEHLETLHGIELVMDAMRLVEDEVRAEMAARSSR